MITLISSKKLGVYKIMRNTVRLFKGLHLFQSLEWNLALPDVILEAGKITTYYFPFLGKAEKRANPNLL